MTKYPAGQDILINIREDTGFVNLYTTPDVQPMEIRTDTAEIRPDTKYDIWPEN